MDIAAERAVPTPFANSTLFTALLLSLARQKHTPTTATTFKNQYDYIVVGAGSAGSVVASRLSEIPCVSVLLLEAGDAPFLVSEVPAIERSLWFTKMDWAFRTVPQKYSGEALVNRQVVWPSGKGLGGSSSLNGMLAVRGNRKNYDDWAALGAKGWSYKDVLPYFIKMEDNDNLEIFENGLHGIAGPMTLETPRYYPKSKVAVLQAAQLMRKYVIDINGPTQLGITDFQETIREGQRCSTAKAYLVPADDRPNLDILPNAFVRKVIINNNRATGVQFDFQGFTYEIGARKEVIMSAGTTNTAQLLMLSGIGPKEELDKHEIPIVSDLPVGKNMQDHCGFPLLFFLNQNIPSATEKLSDPQNIKKYINHRSGPLAVVSLVNALGILNKEFSNAELPSYELYFQESTIEDANERIFGLKHEVFEEVYGPYKNKTLFICISQLLHPRSRGSVTLQSSNPYDPPVIDPNYFEDPRDIQDIVDGLKECMKICTSIPMQRIGTILAPTIFPNCKQYVKDEDLLFACFAKQMPLTFSHQVGTAKMGDPADPSTVVDPQLRVKNIEGLRVVDASVMPLVPSGNTNLPTIMIAEKASDIIKRSIQCGTYPQVSPIHDYHYQQWYPNVKKWAKYKV